MMGGGPGSIYAAHALDAVDQFLIRAGIHTRRYGLTLLGCQAEAIMKHAAHFPPEGEQAVAACHGKDSDGQDAFR